MLELGATFISMNCDILMLINGMKTLCAQYQELGFSMPQLKRSATVANEYAGANDDS